MFILDFTDITCYCQLKLHPTMLGTDHVTLIQSTIVKSGSWYSQRTSSIRSIFLDCTIPRLQFAMGTLTIVQYYWRRINSRFMGPLNWFINTIRVQCTVKIDDSASHNNSFHGDFWWLCSKYTNFYIFIHRGLKSCIISTTSPAFLERYLRLFVLVETRTNVRQFIYLRVQNGVFHWL